MKVSALILTLCTLFYWVEYAVTPRMMAASSCSISAAGAEQSCCQGAAQAKGHDQCPKPSRGCDPSSDCCLNCPLCYVTVLPVSTGRLGTAATSPEYNVWHSNYVYAYHASCWKPPNAA